MRDNRKTRNSKRSDAPAGVDISRVRRNGKPLHGYSKRQWLEEYPWLIWSHSKQEHIASIVYCLPSYQEANHMVEGYLENLLLNHFKILRRPRGNMFFFGYSC